MGQASFVGRFEQSKSEVPVNFDGTADHAIRKLSNSTFVSFVVAFFPLRRSYRSQPMLVPGTQHTIARQHGRCETDSGRADRAIF